MDRLKIVEILPQSVNLNQIDDSPGPYCMSYGFDTAPLAESIRRIGLINPPILVKKGEGGGEIEFSVVAGFRRIRALKTLGETHIPCRVLPPETPPRECLLINLYENLTLRDFNPVEKGMALARLLEWIPGKEAIKTFMPLFDLPSHEETLHLFMQIETAFERPAKDLLASGELSTKAAKLLLEMDSVDREEFCRYFSVIKFSKNQQTQFIEFIHDLSHIENNAIARLLDDPELTDICDNEQMNSPQKARALITLLRSRRLPRLVKAEKGFRRMVEKLALPAGYQITPPPFFEGPHYKLEISFENGNDLMGKLLILVKKEGLVTLEDPWDKSV
ncbi:MAG: ParB N-terminal domain-containing protein [Deltaproteobacteria bacterium]|nr:ParB N-terminal domain-containing protein [Deltaproteobacteria bacterium]